jgi:nitrate/TMAO reductase-like tetraheme cytochrome c subunit
MNHKHHVAKVFPRISTSLVLIAIILIISGCKLIENLHPELAERGEDSSGSKECSECHIDIYNEWAESSHSMSYSSEEFRVSSNNYEYKFCLGCHIPEMIFKTLKNGTDDQAGVDWSKLKNEEIVARSYNLADGVDCQGCHLTVDCTLAGPHAGVSPHPSEKKEELYKRSELCGICHRDTLEEYLAYIEEGGETCQDCHMPAVKRKLIQNEPWQKMHVRKEGKAHTFSSLSAIEKDKDFIELKFTEINYDNNQITGNVEVINNKVSHSIPTGKYGYREVLLLINLKDNLGRIIKSKQESMFVELNTQLKPGEKKIYNFVFDLDGKCGELKELEALLFRTNFNRTDKTQFAKVELELGL